jgi:transcriptional regulator with XRE-family HTH domain
MVKNKNPSRTDPDARKPAHKRRAKILGKRLRARREELGLKQSRVAISLGWDPSRLWEYEIGQAMPRTAALTALARALSISVDELLKGINGSGAKS